ncbi:MULTISPECIES: FAD-binding protein [Nostocales]|uniref:FAD-binding protein n=4 Tax=Nostocales TaxID=1161 RepID=A0A8S9TG41_9CYAN|nr:FAD-binding protein [Tolypothrix bouteillei]KAF3890233.1 FAD-binding protein [Tolypothrix bouteillei VB521301]
MKNNASRRKILQGLIASTVVVGFDPVNRSWVTPADAAHSFINLPHLDGVLYTDDATRASASDDFGHLIHRYPKAVLKPGSIHDIVNIIKFARTHSLKVAARGQGHSCYGQAQVEGGVVIDTSTLNKIHDINAERAIVEAGVRWSELLEATLPQQLTPPVFTDYLELSVGGTLSVGGIGGATHRYGVQVDNVLELQVITGKGDLLTCSPTQNRDLFETVLAGLGQCGIIVRATIRPIEAERNARVFLLDYDDLAAFTHDQRLLIKDERFNYVEGQIVSDPNGGWRYLLEAASFYTPPNEPDNASLLASLNYTQGTAQIEDKTYFDFLNRLAPTVAFLQSIGVWSNPHPWINLFVSGTSVEQYISEVVSTLTLADTGNSPILLYPVKTDRFTRPLFKVPNEQIVFLFAILRTAPSGDDTAIARMLDDNRRLFERNRNLGGTHYPVNAIAFSQEDWQQHFGSVWSRLVNAKRRYDPDNVLTPGQGIFNTI